MNIEKVTHSLLMPGLFTPGGGRVDLQGASPNKKAGRHVTGTAKGLVLSLFFLSLFSFLNAQQISNFHHGANGKAGNPETGVFWIAEPLHSNNSHFGEDMTIPYRVQLSGLDSRQTYCLTIGYNTRVGNAFAIDFLTSFNRTRGHNNFGHTAETVDPVLGTALQGRGLLPTRYTIPAPGSNGSPIAGQPTALFNQQTGNEREFAIYNGTISSMAYVREDPLNGANTQSHFRVCFRVNPGQTTVVLAWGGHIASKAAWADQLLAFRNPANAYQMFLVGCTALSGCPAQPLRVSGEAVIPQGECAIAGPAVLCEENEFRYVSSSPAFPAEQLSWRIINNQTEAVIIGPNTNTRVIISSGKKAGSFTLEITGPNGYSCSRQIFIYGAGAVALQPTTQTVCDGGTGQPLTWTTQRGDSLINPVYILYNQSGQVLRENPDLKALLSGRPSPFGTYRVRVRASLAVEPDCEFRSAPATIIFLEKPRADFSADTVCLGSPTTFRDLSVAAAGDSLVAWQWDFGNGQTSTRRNPVFRFSTSGKIQVRLVVTSSKGCQDTLTREVVVYPRPDPAFTFENNCEGTLTVFDGRPGVPGGRIVLHEWSFGDGAGGFGTPISHRYASPGAFNVRLIVVDERACRDTLVRAITIQPKPSADFTARDTCAGKPVNFRLLNTPASNNLTYRWTFGDGATSSAAAPTRTYANPGSYTVRLILSDENSCEDTATAVVNVFPPGLAQAGPDQQICQGGSAQLAGSISGSATGGRWSDGGINGVFSPGPEALNAVYTPPSGFSGTITLRLSATGGNCASGTDDLVLRVLPLPQVSFNANPVCEGQLMDLVSTSSSSSGAIVNYRWQFGDGREASGNPVRHLYAAPGTFSVSLTVADAAGCVNTAVQQVLVRERPTANFDIQGSCPGAPVTFTSRASGVSNTLTYRWTFGDGTFSSEPNPVHTYNAPGTYNVILNITDEFGCPAVGTRQLIIRPLPQVGFTAAPVCDGQAVVFTNTSQQTENTFSWAFGDGSVSTEINPRHMYARPGIYQVTLTARTAAGCQSTTTRQVEVYARPQAAFSTGSVCDGDLVRFSNTSSAGTGTSLSRFEWRFGNGQTSVQRNPEIRYEEPGEYQVSLIVWDERGCSDTIEQNISVAAAPVPAFVADTVCLGLSTTFVNQSSVPDGSRISWSWNFGDTTSSTEASPNHRYSQSGIFLVRLTATTATGCVRTFEKQVLVLQGPNAAFTVGNLCEGTETVFTNSTSAGSNPAITYSWRFGDGNGSDLISPLHRYAGPGTYLATLMATDGNGCRDTAASELRILPHPVAGFDLREGCQGNELEFRAGGRGGDNLSYTWNFGDETGSAEANPKKTYQEPGTYTVVLVVRDVNGCADTARANVIISPRVVVSAGSDQFLCASGPVTLQGSISGGAVSGRWTDGGRNGVFSPNASALNATYTPPAGFTGTITLTLSSEDPDGPCPAVSDELRLEIGAAAQVSFEARVLCEPNTIQFVNTSLPGSGTIAGIRWDFGNGRFSTEAEPRFVFPAPGDYPVRLTLTDDSGCTVNVEQNVTVPGFPTPDFVADTVCLGAPTTFSDRSTGQISRWLWNFGDGNGSASRQAVHTYASAGTFLVRLTVSNESGCSRTFEKQVVVLAPPQAAFSAANLCQGGEVVFTNNSRAGSNANLNYSWTFGDGGSSGQANPLYRYQTPGAYTATLVAADANACRDTAVSELRILRSPLAGFEAVEACQGTPVNFRQTSQAGDGVVNSYRWDFGDGRSSTELNPSITYPEPGTFRVRLTVQDANGCSNTFESNVQVFPRVLVSAGPDQFLCSTGQVSLQGSISGGATSGRWTDGGLNGSFSPSATALNATYTPPANFTGTIILTLTSDDPAGPCSQVGDELRLEIATGAQVSFTDQVLCEPNTIQFRNTSTPGSGIITGLRWDFGNGQTSTLAAPRNRFPAPGAYLVRLTLTDDRGCTSTGERTIVVPEFPTPNFVADTVCLGAPTTFSDRSTGQISRWLWNFGDGNGSASRQAVHTYASAGTFLVRLTVSNENGCSRTFEKQVVVLAPPQAAFSAANLCQGGEVVFTNNSRAGSNANLNYSWTFGDGGSSGQANPLYRYQTPGAYTVTLVAADANACRDTAVSELRILRSPLAGFEAVEACQGTPVNFRQTSQAGDGALSTYRWDFGDGRSSTEATPSITYQQAGTFRVRLTVQDVNGCSNTFESNVQVFPRVQVSAGPDQFLCAAGPVSLQGSISGGATSGRWTDGGLNGSFSPSATALNATYTPPANYTGIIILTLTSDDPAGPCVQAVDELRLEIGAGAQVRFEAQALCEPNTIQFRNTSLPGSGIITGLRWDFGNGQTSTLAAPRNRFPAPGAYIVRLTLTDDRGCTSVGERVVTVSEFPVANFVADTVCLGTPTTFRDRSSGQISRWLWNFGDGNGSASRQPSHTFAAAGVYRVRLTVSNEEGCSQTIEKQVVVQAQPQVSFTASNLCAGDQVLFQNTTTGASGEFLLYEWQFGDGFGSLQENPSHQYAGPGQYNVTLRVTNEKGCTAERTQSIRIQAPPALRFDLMEACQGTPVTIIPTVQAGGSTTIQFNWNLGNGQTSTQREPTVTFAQAGNVLVRVTATDANGCSSAYQAVIRVNAAVIVQAGADQTVCGSAPVGLQGQITGGTASGRWSDGGVNGSFSPGATALNATYTPPAGFTGRITLTLTSDDPAGPCPASSDQMILTVNAPVSVQAGADQAICSAGSITLQGRVTGGITSGRWSDGGRNGAFSPSATALNATYTPPAGFTGPIALTLTSDDPVGPCSAVSDEMILTINPAVVVDAGADQAICVGTAAQLNGRISGGITTGRWSDGGRNGVFSPSAEAPNPTYTPAAGLTGPITLTLSSADPDGPCGAVLDQMILTVNALPVASFRAAEVCERQAVQFVNTSTPGTGTISSVRWEFGGGQTSAELQPGFVFPGSGSFLVKLTVTNSAACSQSVEQTVNVRPRPVAAFTAAGSCPGQPVVFSNQSTVAEGRTASYEWNFGDGNTSTAASPTHIYASSGSYMVRLRVTDDSGCSTTMQREVTIRPVPLVSFTAAPVCEGGDMVFINTSQGANVSLTGFRWNFGDGAGSQEQNPRHRYSDDGTFNVVLTVTDNFGCVATATQPVQVLKAPTVAFEASGACEGAEVSFTNASTAGSAPIASYFWEFPNGRTSSLREPRFQFTAIGTYPVRLSVIDSNGCRSILEKQIAVLAPPKAAFTTTTACEGTEVIFTNQSQPGGSGIDRYQWQFGNGQRSTETSPRHLYTAAGEYQAVLTVFDQNGCQSTVIQTVSVLARPVADFTSSVNCDTRVVNFVNRASTPTGTITAYSWTFGDGNGSQSANPVHTYALAGSFRVVLEVTNSQGCTQRLERNVVVPAAPEAAFTITSGCEADGNDIQMVNQSKPAPGGSSNLSYLWIVRDPRGREVARSVQTAPAFDLAPNTYTVELTVSDGNGCNGLLTRSVTLFADPAVQIAVNAARICQGEGAELTASPSGGTNCGPLEWQVAQSTSGPWTTIAGAVSTTYRTPTNLNPGRYFYRVLYRCGGLNCTPATSNTVSVEVGSAVANIACIGRINVPLGENCRVLITPEMVGNGTFGHCLPYRAEDFEVIVYDGSYPNGQPDNVAEVWGVFPYTLQLKPSAVAAGGVFTPCWGEVLVADQSAPKVNCPADVTGLLRRGSDYRPAFQASDAAQGERFFPLICTDLSKIFNVSRSWTDENYTYFTGIPQVTDCGRVTLVSVEDKVEEPGCTPASLSFGGQISARLLRTFTYVDESGNRGKCDQTIYFFRPRIQLPDCQVKLDLCAYGEDQPLTPTAVGSAPYYFNGAGDTLQLLSFVCGFSVVYADQTFPGPPNCGFKVVRTWTILDDCRSAGLQVDLVDLPLTAVGCAGKPSWVNGRLTFEQQISVGDTRAPVVSCPTLPKDATEQVFSTGPFNCTAVINPAPPTVSGECQNWTWSFEVWGFVVNPLTMIPEYKLIGRSQNQILAGAPLGEYDLIYQVSDLCGNATTSAKCRIRVVDRIDPIAICEDQHRVSLSSGNANGVAILLAQDVDENSSDNCGPVELQVRRQIVASCLDTYIDDIVEEGRTFADLRRQTTSTAGRVEYYFGNQLVIVQEGQVYWSNWDRAVFFTCCDIGSTSDGLIPIELRVTDKAGNFNLCNSKVQVEDKLPPRCIVSDLVIRCTELNFDPRDSAQVAARFGGPEQVVTILDNCGATVRERIVWTPSTCGRGVLERIFTVTDNSGLSSSCTQTITVTGVVNYEVRLPADGREVTCGTVGDLDVQSRVFGCDLLAVNRDTVRFDPPQSVCLRLMITYSVINWCEYDAIGNTTPTRIPRDIDADNNLEEPIWLVVAFDSTFNAVVAKLFGVDAEGKRLAAPSRIYKPGDVGYNPGFFQYSQFVNIVDNTPPTVVIETNEREFCSNESPATGCKAPYQFSFSATDNCPLNQVQLQETRLRLGSASGPEIPATGGAYAVVRAGNRFTVSGSLAVGTYHLALRFSDGCGNLGGQSLVFSIKDCKAPAPICKEILTADLSPVDSDGDGRIDGGTVTVPATAFVASNIDDCSPFPDEPVRKVKYFVGRQEPRTRADLVSDSITFTCNDVDSGLVKVYLTALDAAGNFDYCEVRVFVNPGVDPDPCNIPTAEGAIGGRIRTEDRDPVEEVMVRLSGQASGAVMTDRNGTYFFDFLEEGYDYTVAPALNREFVNGVTTFDLLQISKHILATDRLDSPYQMIAADANNDKKITSFDLIQFRKLILTLVTSIDGNTSWRFVDGKYQFPDPANPWNRPFPEIINVNDLLGLKNDGDFVAIKIGDINGNARTTKFYEPEPRSTEGTFTLRTEELDLQNGQVYEIPFYADDLAGIDGFQFTMGWDRRALSFVDLRDGRLSAEQLGLFLEEGLLTASWISTQPGYECGDQSEPCPLFTLVLRAERSGNLSQALSIHSRRTAAEAYDKQGRLLDLGLAFGSETATLSRFQVFTPQPNPWREYTYLGFELPAAGAVSIRILDINGRTLRYLGGPFEKGYNELRIDKEGLPSGVLYIVVETKGETAVRKMILLR